jgi:hypothetical protein
LLECCGRTPEDIGRLIVDGPEIPRAAVGDVDAAIHRILGIPMLGAQEAGLAQRLKLGWIVDVALDGTTERLRRLP